ncbi:hypothetical protein [Neobacillus mesonae]|uniref:hypothetical protein n=1 Tax=Neobacillus mesonae TaxID=1193713 RepID=UPI002573AD94|nr:hypothetical protein [Neobacillus mesonae]
MHLSRVEKYKKKRKTFFRNQDTDKKTPLKTYLLTGVLGTAIITSNSIAFANTDISQILQKWYFDKLTSVEESLSISVMAETNKQKAILLKRIREQTEKSIKEIQDYADKQEKKINKNVQEKMEEASKVIQDKNKTEVNTQKQLIDKKLGKDLKVKETEQSKIKDKNEDNKEIPESKENIEEKNKTEGQINNDTQSGQNPENQKNTNDKNDVKAVSDKQ